jgi:hypothetical protein
MLRSTVQVSATPGQAPHSEAVQGYDSSFGSARTIATLTDQCFISAPVAGEAERSLVRTFANAAAHLETSETHRHAADAADI